MQRTEQAAELRGVSQSCRPPPPTRIAVKKPGKSRAKSCLRVSKAPELLRGPTMWLPPLQKE
jgi:hypothetical protein